MPSPEVSTFIAGLPKVELGSRSATCARTASGTASRQPRTRRSWSTSPSIGVPLEACPTSSLRTNVVARIEDDPFPVLRAAGVPVTLSSDDPGMFATSLDHEYAVAHDVFGLDERAPAGIARAGVDASYAPADVRDRISAELDAYVRKQVPTA